MTAKFTIKNTSPDCTLEVAESGEGTGGRDQPQKKVLQPDEEQSYSVDKNTHVTVREGDEEPAPTPHKDRQR